MICLQNFRKTSPSHADRSLRDLQIGETAYIPTLLMKVAAGGECYLDPKAPLLNRSSLTMMVRRAEDGYHVTIIAKSDWKPGAPILEDYIPLESITMNLDPDLDKNLQVRRLEKMMKRMTGKP